MKNKLQSRRNLLFIIKDSRHLYLLQYDLLLGGKELMQIRKNVNSLKLFTYRIFKSDGHTVPL